VWRHRNENLLSSQELGQYTFGILVKQTMYTSNHVAKYTQAADVTAGILLLGSKNEMLGSVGIPNVDGKWNHTALSTTGILWLENGHYGFAYPW